MTTTKLTAVPSRVGTRSDVGSGGERARGKVSSVRVTHADTRPAHLTAVIYLFPVSAAISAEELAVILATRLEGCDVLTRASVSVSGALGHAGADVICTGGW